MKSGRPASPFARLLAFGSWLIVIGSAVVLAMRWLPPIHSLTVAATALLPFAVIPLSMAAVLAGLIGRFRLATVAFVVSFASLAAVGSADLSGSCSPFEERETPRGESVVVYTANVLSWTAPGEADRLVADIVSADADVVMMQEVTWEFWTELAEDPRLEEYDVRLGPGRTQLWTRLELLEDRTDLADGHLVSALLDGPAGPFHVSSVHMAAPFIPEAVPVWKGQFDELSAETALGLITEPDVPRLVAGDFNATDAHRPFRQLLATGLTDAQQTDGCGLGLSWPIDHIGPVPFPVFALDHVLVSDAFEVRSVRVGSVRGEPIGSDHHPVIAELAVP